MSKKNKPQLKDYPQLKEYLCRGRLTLDGVCFTIQAHSEEEAAYKAGVGAWSDWDTSGAESIDWELDPRTVEEN